MIQNIGPAGDIRIPACPAANDETQASFGSSWKAGERLLEINEENEIDEREMSMTNEEAASELIEALTRRHHDKIEQLTNLFESEGGFEVFTLASRVIGNALSAADWLTSGQIGLNGAIPAAVALDAEGREAVRTYLQQIDYGVYV